MQLSPVWWRAVLLSLVLAGGLAVACSPSGGQLPPPGSRASSTEDRQDCGEIYGTAFRSQNERKWYEEKCSKWPLVKVDQGPVSFAQSAPEPDECRQIRGKPYENDDQRRWYLANCMGNSTQQAQGGGDAQSSGDRTNCDEIRGTPYRSDSERRWYQANCPANQPSSGPDRTDCNAIRGTQLLPDTDHDHDE
jgi:hypothetical protein